MGSGLSTNETSKSFGISDIKFCECIGEAWHDPVNGSTHDLVDNKWCECEDT